jgi:hypothetical protein
VNNQENPVVEWRRIEREEGTVTETFYGLLSARSGLQLPPAFRSTSTSIVVVSLVRQLDTVIIQ